MDFYKITFVNKEVEPVSIEFTKDDINTFNVSFRSNFSSDFRTYIETIDPKDIKVQILVGFICKQENFNKINSFITLINKLESIEEVIVYQNDNLICDLKNILDVSSNSNLVDTGAISGFTLNIIEGV